MQRNIEEAFKLYSGDRPLGLFADKLEHNLEKMNALYDDIGSIFRSAGIENFEKLPVDHTERGQFAKLFKQLNSYLEAATVLFYLWFRYTSPLPTTIKSSTQLAPIFNTKMGAFLFYQRRRKTDMNDHSNPVNRRDDGGDLWEYVVGKMIVGTVVGGLTGGISSMLDDAAAGKEVSLASFAKGFFPGMLSGAVSTAASLVMEGLVPLISILRAPKDAERAIRMAEVVASAICATISAIRNRESLPDALLSIGSAAAAAYISNRVSPSGHSAGAIIGGGITSFAVGGAVSSAKTAIHISINSSRNRGPARRVTV